MLPPVTRIPCWFYLKKIQGLLHLPLQVWRGEVKRDDIFLQKQRAIIDLSLFFYYKLQTIAQFAAAI